MLDLFFLRVNFTRQFPSDSIYIYLHFVLLEKFTRTHVAINLTH